MGPNEIFILRFDTGDRTIGQSRRVSRHAVVLKLPYRTQHHDYASCDWVWMCRDGRSTDTISFASESSVLLPIYPDGHAPAPISQPCMRNIRPRICLQFMIESLYNTLYSHVRSTHSAISFPTIAFIRSLSFTRFLQAIHFTAI